MMGTVCYGVLQKDLANALIRMVYFSGIAYGWELQVMAIYIFEQDDLIVDTDRHL